jgi:transcriptional regulator with XRE-family HTH domain
VRINIAEVAMPMIDRKKLYEEVGRRVKAARDAYTPSLTQGELAEKLNVERTSITNIEKGTQRATLHFLYLLAQQLQIPLARLLPSLDDEKIAVSGGTTEVTQVRLDKKRTMTVPSKVKSIYDSM